MKEYKTNVKTNGNKVFIPGEHDAISAIKVSRWTRGVDTMLPKSPREVLDMFAAGNSVLVKNADNVLVGHAAATATYKDKSIEVGSIYTNSEFRHGGVGTLATKVVLETQRIKHDQPVLFALGNEMSGRMFSKMQARVMKATELSDEVWEACEGCPRKPEQTQETFMCCDTPYNLTYVPHNGNLNPILGCGR